MINQVSSRFNIFILACPRYQLMCEKEVNWLATVVKTQHLKTVLEFAPCVAMYLKETDGTV